MMFRKSMPYYVANTIRHNNEVFEIGYRFAENDLKKFTQEELERLIKIGAVVTDRNQIEQFLSSIAERDKQFRITSEAMNR